MEFKTIYLISETHDAVYQAEYLKSGKVKVIGAHLKVGAISEEFELADFEQFRAPLQLSNMKQYNRLSKVYLEN